MTIQKWRLLVLQIIIFFLPVLLISQDKDYVVKTYTTENGLVNNNVRSITRDDYGFLWISTWDGLSRFDGLEFRNYHHDPDDSTSLPYFELRKVTVDRDNNVWIVSQYLSKYDRANDNFINYRFNCSNSQGFQELQAVCAIDPGNIWFYCNDGAISKFNSETRTIKEYRHLSFKGVTNRFEVIKDRFFLINWQIISEYFINDEVDSLIFVRDYLLPDSTLKWQEPGAGYCNTTHLVFKIKNDMYFQFTGSTFVFDKNTGRIEPFIPKENDWYNLQNEGINWLFTKNGLVIKPETSQNAILIHYSDAGYPQSCYYDNGGAFWIGGYSFQEQGYGLKALIPVPSFFKHHLQNYDSGEKIAVFSCIKDHTGQVWIGIKGLKYFIRLKQNGEVEHCNFIGDEEMRKSMHPRSFLELGDSILLIGYYGDLFRRFDYSTQLFSPVPEINFGEKKITPLSTKLLAKYDENHIIIGADTIIYVFDFKNNRITNAYVLSKMNAMSLSVDSDGTIWVGYHFGFLHHLDSNLNPIEVFRIGNSNLESICQTEDGIIWIASLGEGLFRFDKRTKKWNSFNTGDGLVNNVLYNVLKDRKGNLWMSSDHGISMFNPREETFRNYGLSDGLLIDEFNADAAYLAPDGEMIFGGVGGVVRFYPDSIVENSMMNPPKLLISDLQVSGRSRRFEKAVYELEKLELNKGDNNVKLFFTCTDLKNADKIRYRYRMEKVDNDWIATDHRNRSVSYSGLAPGNYHFLLEASNPVGDWEYKTSITINIPAYFYQTWWFRALIVMLVAGLILIFALLRLKQIQIKNRQMQQNLRLESLRGQLNPHFIYNSLNSINYFISKSDRENANQYIADFARLMRAILNNSTSDFIPLNKEIEAVSDYLKLENMRFSDKFDFEIEVSPNLEIENIEVAPTMLQPFIENSIWHGVRYLEGRKGKIVVRFGHLHEKFLLCLVEDDGIGRKLSSERKSIDQKKRRSRGISIIMERLAILNLMNKSNCRIMMEDLFREREESSTKITVELPVRLVP